MSDPKEVPQVNPLDPKRVQHVNPIMLFTRNRYARATGVALVPVILIGIVVLVPRLTSHPGQHFAPVPNAPARTSSPLPTVTYPTTPVKPSPAAKKTGQPPPSPARKKSPTPTCR